MQGQQNESGREGFVQIQASVQRVRDLARGRLALEGLIFALAASVAALVLGVVLFMFAPPVLWLRGLVALAWVGACAALIWWRWLRPAKDWEQLHQVGRRVESSFPALRNDVTASLEFGRQIDQMRQDNHVSVAMVEQLLHKTQRDLTTLGQELDKAAPPAQLKVPVGLTAAALAVLLACALLAPEATLRGARGLLTGPELAVALDTGKARASIIGDILLHYQYPDYTGLGQRTVQNSTGEVEVLKGTQVEVEGISLRSIQKAELVLTLDQPAEASPEGEPEAAQPGKATQRIVLQRRPGGRLVASMIAMHSGSYTVEATLEDGTEVHDGITRAIRVVPDESPRIEVPRPQGEVDVSPQDQVTFNWLASDDFGLAEVALVTAFAGDEKNRKRTVIYSPEEQRDVLPGDARPVDNGAGAALREKNGDYVLDLAPFELQPRDKLLVYLEAVDNDAITGPKVTASPPVVLKVSSPEDKHLELIQSQEELFEAMLLLLADYLEEPLGDSYTEANGAVTQGVPPEWSAQKLSEVYKRALGPFEGAGQVLETMSALVERMKQDPLMLKRDFEMFSRTFRELTELRQAEGKLLDQLRPASIEARLSRNQMQRLFGARTKTVRGTEHAIIRIEDLVASQRMENLLDTAKSLQDAKDRLKELLEKYKESKDPALKAEIMRQMQRLRDRMREVMQKMQSQLKKLPKEHMNLEALERKEMAQKASDAANSMEEMMKALEDGDIDKAMAMMEQMEQDIDSMVSNMEGDFEEMQPEGLNELDKKASELMDQINDLEAQEKQIAKETQQLTEDMERQHQEKMQEQLSAFEEKARAQLDQIRKELDQADTGKLNPRDQRDVERARERVDELERALKQKDVAQAAEKAQQLSQDLDRARFSLEFQKNAISKNDPRRQSYQKSQQSVKKAQPPARDLQNKLQQMMQRGGQPQPSPQQAQKMEQLRQQQQQARQNAQKLGEEVDKAGGDFPMLKEELGPGLGEAQQYMEGAEKRLGQAQGRKAHENEKLALDKLGGLKKSLKQALKKERMGGQQGGQQRGKRLSHEKVKIPGRDGQAPREFREDIMDAMKENGLDDYDQELKAYYESLVK
jgi:hypothetical protein